MHCTASSGRLSVKFIQILHHSNDWIGIWLVFAPKHRKLVEIRRTEAAPPNPESRGLLWTCMEMLEAVGIGPCMDSP